MAGTLLSRLNEVYDIIIGWLMRIGIGWAAVMVTLFSISVSVLLTWLRIQLMSARDIPLQEWLVPSVLVPSIVAPIVAAAMLSLAYKLAEARESLAHAAHTDTLTKIGNRRAFIEAAQREIERNLRDDAVFSILMLDVDHFKRLNDRHGHAAGDDALVAIAQSLVSVLRNTDLVCRWGGEEFIVLLPATHLADALSVAEKLRLSLPTLSLNGVDYVLTASIGAATYQGSSQPPDNLIALADRQLYLAKQDGRNRVMPAHPALSHQTGDGGDDDWRARINYAGA